MFKFKSISTVFPSSRNFNKTALATLLSVSFLPCRAFAPLRYIGSRGYYRTSEFSSPISRYMATASTVFDSSTMKGVSNSAQLPSSSNIPPFISTADLASLLYNKESTPVGNTLRELGLRVRLIDATWLLPNSGEDRGGLKEFQSVGRIPNAVFMDIDACANLSVPSLKHMLPSEKTFSHYLHHLFSPTSPESYPVVDQEKDLFVLYDSLGVFSSPRAWCMFRAFSYPRVTILNGGFPKWVSEGFPIIKGHWEHPFNTLSDGITKILAKSEDELQTVKLPPVSLHPGLFHSMKSILDILASMPSSENKPAIVDARSQPRFLGQVAEANALLKRGRIPHSQNIPFGSCLDAFEVPNTEVGRTLPARIYTVFKDKSELKDVLSVLPELTSTQNPSIITYCGSGLTAAVVLVSMYATGAPLERLSIFDGSWTEWSLRQQNLI